MSLGTLQTYEYVEGRPHPNTQGHATYYCKPSSPGYTGGGYYLWRSEERRPHTPTQGKEGVYVAEHRLLAVSECYPSDMPIDEVLEDLHGKDVHHTTGMPGLNFHESPNLQTEEITGLDENDEPKPGIEVLDHGEHSEVTQSEMRAWGEDAKRAARNDEPEPEADRCARCDGETDVLWQCDDFEGVRCTECAKIGSDESPLEVA